MAEVSVMTPAALVFESLQVYELYYLLTFHFMYYEYKSTRNTAHTKSLNNVQEISHTPGTYPMQQKLKCIACSVVHR